MNTLEIAQKYGVPTPETCKELDFKGETNYFWTLWNGVFYLGSQTSNKLIGEGKNMILVSHYGYFESIPAPQMHEIAVLLPQYLTINGVSCEFVIEWNRVGYHYLEDMYKVERKSNGILPTADELAQLYIKLKKENLL